MSGRTRRFLTLSLPSSLRCSALDYSIGFRVRKPAGNLAGIERLIELTKNH